MAEDDMASGCAMTRSYILKTQSNQPWMSFDSLARARAVQDERRARGINLRLVEQVITEREVA